MYKIETSVGDIYFDLPNPSINVYNTNIKFVDDGENKLNSLYKYYGVGYVSSNGKQFLQIHLFDDHYGTPEYRIIAKEEEEQVDKLKAKITRLKEKIKYSPGNEGFVEAQNHFESLV